MSREQPRFDIDMWMGLPKKNHRVLARTSTQQMQETDEQHLAEIDPRLANRTSSARGCKKCGGGLSHDISKLVGGYRTLPVGSF